MRRQSAADVSEEGSGIEFRFGPLGAQCSALEHIHPGYPWSSPSLRQAVQGRPDARAPHCPLCLVPAASPSWPVLPLFSASWGQLTVHPDGTQALGGRGVHPPLLPSRWPHPAGPQVPHLWCSCLLHAPPQAPPGFLSPVVRGGLSAGRAQSPSSHFDHLIL